VVVRPLGDDDQRWKEETLRRAWGSTAVARLGVLVDAAALPGLMAVVDGRPAGLLTWDRHGDDIEVVTLQAENEGGGVGRALMDAVLNLGRHTGARRIWLVTTNDNVRAIGFYQRWGMDLVRFVRHGVDVSRRVKPEIPQGGDDGIPVRHELEFEVLLDRSSS
jgi:ribosomal protein S18 acetylase RimI-like enzyme